MSIPKLAIFPGSFDPVHKGHIEIMKKASRLFDKLYVVVTINPEKASDSSFTQRKVEIQNQIKDLSNVEVLVNRDIMTAQFAQTHGIKYLVRSARDNIDFNYEMELAAGNHHLNSELETILIIPSYENINYKSRLIKQRIQVNK